MGREAADERSDVITLRLNMKWLKSIGWLEIRYFWRNYVPKYKVILPGKPALRASLVLRSRQLAFCNSPNYRPSFNA